MLINQVLIHKVMINEMKMTHSVVRKLKRRTVHRFLCLSRTDVEGKLSKKNFSLSITSLLLSDFNGAMLAVVLGKLSTTHAHKRRKDDGGRNFFLMLSIAKQREQCVHKKKLTFAR